MKIKAIMTEKFGKRCLLFDNYMVIEESSHFYGVYQNNLYNILITSGETMQQAAKKAKLLQIGYNQCKEYLSDWI